ncbi:hypothetical protein DSECCO2_427320 [anaerobic digester metagenome]
MKKLSELSMDTMLCVGHQNDREFDVMPKEDYLRSYQFLDYPAEPFTSVCLADKSVLTFDLFDAIERIGDGSSYEGWDEDVYNDIKDLPETKAFLEKFKEVSERNPTYWEGEAVEIDMIPEQEAAHD